MKPLKLFIASLVLGISSQVSAQSLSKKLVVPIDTVCYPADALVNSITKDFGESLIGYGKSEKGVVSAIFFNHVKKTYTIVLNMQNGYVCVLDAGSDFKLDNRHINIKGTM